MRIVEVAAIRISVPRISPFELARGTFTAADHVLVRITLEDGTVGFGESAPMAEYSEETQASVYSVITERLAPAISGADAFNMADVHRLMDAASLMNPMAKAGVDMALYDSVGKALNVPASTLLGGAYRARIPLAQSVGAQSDDEAVDQARRALDEGYHVVKLKGGRDPVSDLRRIECLRSALGETFSMRLDANAGYRTSDQVILTLSRAEQAGLTELEQPLGRFDTAGMARIAAALKMPLIADESCFSASDAVRCIHAGSADVVNVKVQKAGGMYPALRMAAAVEAAGAGLLVGAVQETGVGTAASLQLASAVDNLGYASDCRTHTAMRSTLLSDEIRVCDGWAHVPDGPGLGVRVDEAEVARYSQGTWSVLTFDGGSPEAGHG